MSQSKSHTDLSHRVNLSRRSFIKATGTGVALGYAAPMILHAGDKAGAKAPVLGAGNHTYELVEGWGTLPDGKRFGNTDAVVETGDGRIFIHNPSPTGDATCIFDADGKFIKSWGKQFAAGAHGMDLRKEGNQEFLYLASTSLHKFFKTTLDGEVVLELDYPKEARNDKGEPCYADQQVTGKDGVARLKRAGEFFVPTFTAFNPNGDFYITDGYGAGYIHRYNIKGEYLHSFGGKGDADDKTACPHGIFCDTRDPARPMLVVADREHHRLQYFTLEGKLDHLVVNESAEATTKDTGRLRRPCQFTQRGGELLIPDLRGRVTILDKDNNVVVQLGDNPNIAQRANNTVKPTDLTPGIFCAPHGATWDRAGNIYVAEALPFGRVSKLRHVSA